MRRGPATPILEPMTAREIDETAVRLRELRADLVANLALAAIAFGLALGASTLWVPFALPLLAGGLTATVLGMRAFVRRSFLLDDLAEEPDAHSIPAVRRHVARTTPPAGPPQR